MNAHLVLIPKNKPTSEIPNEAQKISRVDPLAPTIFHEEWWLDAATGGNFKVAEVSAGGRVIGRLPYSTTKRLGMSMIRMPDLTYFLGPAVEEGEGTLNTRFLTRLDITRELIRKLPRASWQYVKCHGGVTEVIAFQDLGFRTYVQFTHELAPQPIDALWNGMRNKTRNIVRRAQERFSVSELHDPSELVHVFERNLQSQGIRNTIDGALCRKIISAALERKRGRILAARDADHTIVAANLCVWDNTTSFYLFSTRCDSSGNNASTLLLWEAIQESARQGLVFDMAGLGTQGHILLYAGFGATICPRYVAVRSRPLARLMNELKFMFAPENYFY
jgi:Acetyltransferase (GNAT) domain